MSDWKNDYLKDEYLKLQDQYEDYDRRALQIKGWIGAGTIAAFGIGLNEPILTRDLVLFTIALISLCFWYLEAKWKLFQYAITDRIRILEAHFRQDEEILFKDPEPLQIYNWWFRSYSRDEPIYPYEREFRPKSRSKRLASSAFQTFVHLPYSLIILLCILAYILKNIGYLN